MLRPTSLPFGRGGSEGISLRSTRTLLWVCLVLISACAGSGPPPTEPGGTFDRLQADIFNQHCLRAGCHNPQAQAGALDLSPSVSYDALVNVAPDNSVARAEGLKRVDPFAPDNSFILRKLRGPAPGEGSQMPFGMSPLSE